MDDRIMKKRIKAIRQKLAENGIDCLIITKPANVTYTTAFRGDDSWAVITARDVCLLTDSRYVEQAQKECLACRVICHNVSLSKAAAELLKKLKSVRTMAVEKSVSVADFELLKKNVNVRLKTVAGVIETVRSCKDGSEIAAIKKAAQIAAKALEKTLGYIRAGITENELAGMLNFQIRKLGAANSFDTIVAFGPNASRPHHRPTQRKLKRRDTVLIDFGVKYEVYCCDITRCFAVGGPTILYKKVYDAVQKAQTAAIKMIKPGADITSIDAVARDVIRKNALPVYGHGTGHGLGLEIHELPYLKAKGKDELKAGQVITVEPGVYIPGKLGIRIEDDILVTKTGCQILTRDCPKLLLLSRLRG